ncbi:MAG: hypothetical protein LKM45_02235 [Wolbachia endosymbiont of Alcedoecus sp.]|nr:hypothetical protein [Wolbachia endosymbiont of Alcedoecus sp.]
MSADLSYVAEKLNNFSDAKYWMHRQFGDFILNRASVVNELLGIKRTDDEDLLDDYDRYQVVCWLCSEESIRKNFPSLKQYQGDSDSEGKFVTDTLSSYSRLMEFWSHYIHIMDKNGDLISNPNEEILNNFKELIAKYNKYHKNLYYNSQVDLWKYGFECAKKEGCIEALEFFLDKLEGRITQDERDEILINTALYATSYGSFNLGQSNANVICHRLLSC